ncbi:MAG: LPP20 family lipoprotein [Spirochaetaceae bacterium]|jgi:hypothetical protein|nr:LPP20 family lipoprotein [Spirochaetaceae bacterium]
MKNLSIYAIFVLGAVFLGCVSVPASNPAKETEAAAAAEAAIGQMNDGGNVKAPAEKPAGVQKTPAAAATSGKEPLWVSSPYSVYDKSAYIAAVGEGSNRTAAEKAAFGALTSVFGQSVQADLETLNVFSQAVKNGAVDSAENTSIKNTIITSSGMDSLVGAEIGSVWQNKTDKSWYAVAVMDKAKTSVLYADMIRDNERYITKLVDSSGTDKESLYSFSCYLLAATVADANEVYAGVLSYIGNVPADISGAEMKTGDDYRLLARKIARNIPVAVNVSGDMENRIENAFASSLSGLGFKSGGKNNRYVLQATVTLKDASVPGSQYIFCNYNIDSYIVDTSDGSKIVPYNISDREGHKTMDAAKDRAINSASKKIADSYKDVFENYFSTSVVKK